ncbi:MAG: glycosyltransferase family 9 protein [Bacteroidales bacterium]|nr:glycosyltransferase family 9 protein [Bacteroidales bacterium]
MHKILIIQTASIGDVVLATPVVEKLRTFYPDAELDFLIKKGIESLLIGHPKINRVLVWDKTGQKYREILDLVKLIRRHRYDAVVNLQRFTSTGLITVLSGADIKLGFTKNPFSVFFTKSQKHRISSNPQKSEHEVHRNLAVIDMITDKSRDFQVRLYPSQTDFARVSQFKTIQYITISPASLWFTKQYPPEKWTEFLQAIDKALMVYFLGSKHDKKLCEQIITASGHANSMNLSGKLTFLESAALMKHAIMNFVNDSAPQHFASAMNAPLTAVFCSTVPAYGFGPLSDNSMVIEVDEALNCRPCGLHGHKACPEGHFKCALNISKEKLLKRVQ